MLAAAKGVQIIINTNPCHVSTVTSYAKTRLF